MSSKLRQPEENQPIPQVDAFDHQLGPTLDQQGGNQFEQQHMDGLGQDPAQPSTLDVLMAHGVPEARAGETNMELSDTLGVGVEPEGGSALDLAAEELGGERAAGGLGLDGPAQGEPGLGGPLGGAQAASPSRGSVRTYKAQIEDYFRVNATYPYDELVADLRKEYAGDKAGLRALTKAEAALAKRKPTLRGAYDAALLGLPLDKVERFRPPARGKKSLGTPPKPRPFLKRHLGKGSAAYEYMRMCTDRELRRHLVELVAPRMGGRGDLQRKADDKAAAASNALSGSLSAIEGRIELSEIDDLIYLASARAQRKALEASSAIPQAVKTAFIELYDVSKKRFSAVLEAGFKPLHTKKKKALIDQAVAIADPKNGRGAMSTSEFQQLTKLEAAAKKVDKRVAREMEKAISNVEIDFMYSTYAAANKRVGFNHPLFAAVLPKYEIYLQWMSKSVWKGHTSRDAYLNFNRDYKVLADLKADAGHGATPPWMWVLDLALKGMAQAGRDINEGVRRTDLQIRNWGHL